MNTTNASIGTRLKDARGKKSITLEDVHAKIKIHPRVLQLLEEDKFEKLPSPLFAKNFLKSYAEFLEVNSDELLQAYDKQEKKETEQILYLQSADERIRALKKTGGNAFFVWLLLGAFLFAFGGFYFLFKTGHMSPHRVKAARHEKIVSEDKIPAKKSEERAVLKEEGEKTATEMLNSVELGNFPKIDKKTPLNLQIRALETVWVHVIGDGKALYQGFMKKGESKSWSSKISLEIRTGNATNMAMILNKMSLGSPGRAVSKKMLITHEGIKNLTQGKLT